MNFKFVPINIEYVKEIDSWNYEGFIEQVMMTPYFESFKKTGELIGPGGFEGFVALHDHEAVGLFEFNIKDSIMEIGLALKPELIGKGLGTTYVNQGIEFGMQYYDKTLDHIKLVVDSKNKPAIRVYEKAGFHKVEEKDGEIEMRMVL
ncbi:GNAT family N-acetyltransferase [Pontibacillus sp. HMF3514]|uniref:GNAT family N-acetyltransferase n=1 Tax=Pontibacillus sp. HMF3514 TaxID=2692425 RepID=UPI00131FC830|nr:GNAT family N-acetyltransferase [Pontibacillus sp. HMF3514]QHE51611.1 GNAT family N-acetyltransferase [Pontibacillus sp. HMF3514]